MTVCRDVLAVVVTYCPDPGQLKRTLDSLKGQVGSMALIDNTPGGLPDPAKVVALEMKRSGADVYVIENRENLGIAAAQNIGIEIAQQKGVRFIFLSDQDSEFQRETVAVLRSGWELMTAQGRQVAAVAAGYVNDVTGVDRRPAFDAPVFVQHEGYRARRIRRSTGLVPATYVIASGCLIPLAAIEKAGRKDETLFIDWVDTEWCLRARKADMEIYGSADVVVAHRLGDRVAHLFGKAIPIHSPIRHYYMVRNAVRLCLYSKVLNPRQRARIGVQAILFALCFPLLAKPAFAHLKMVSLGLLHGVLDRKGRLDV